MLYNQMKIARGYGTQYHNNLIPCNAIYGRYTKYIYVYVTDFKLYSRRITCNKEKVNQLYFKIHKMDYRKSTKFSNDICPEGSVLFNEIMDLLEKQDHWDAQIKYCCEFNRDKFNSCIRTRKSASFRHLDSHKNRGEKPLEFHEAIMAHVYVTKNHTRSLPQNI